MRTWHGFTHEQRMAGDRLVKEAIARGELPPPTKCSECGQEQGIIHYHQDTYTDPVRYSRALCWRCHMVTHSEHINQDACEAYWASIRAGKVWPPVFRHDFKVLAKDHGITKVRDNK